MNLQRKMKKRVKNRNKINTLQKLVNRRLTKHKKFKSVMTRSRQLKVFVSMKV